MKTIVTFLLISIFAGLASSPPSGPMVTSLVGTTDNPEARQDFEKGLLLLHNFEYPDAAQLFRQAQEKDPLFALAYWGEAMTYNHPIWLQQDLEEGRAALKKYDAVAHRQTKKLTSMDADLLRSLDVLYGDGTKMDRDKAYAELMASLYEKYRGNHDVATFYALSLLGQAGGWNETLCNKAANIAGAVLKENPEHPGGLHYFIHAEDHPEFAKLALKEANVYAKVASYSGHALHMPSHIYLALGMWDDVVRSNEISWQAGVDRKEAKKLNNDGFNYHAHWWLAYGYLQQGRFSKAEEVLKKQLTITRELPSAVARNHFVIMRGHYLLETNDWKNPLAKEQVKTQGLRIEIRTLDQFVQALSAFKARDKESLRKIVNDIESDLSQAKQMAIMNEDITQCKAAPSRNSGETQASILLEESKGLLAFMNGDRKGADAHFREAVRLEEENGHFFGPPEILKTTHELYGEYLMSIGRHQEAIISFEKALQKAPGRNQALAGLMRSLALTGDKKKEKQIAETLNKNFRHAEVSSVDGIFPRP